MTIQAQYLELLKDIQRETGVALIFVTHNLGIVAKMCDRMAVMYAGKIVEQGSVRDLFNAPKHPYTRALLGSIAEARQQGAAVRDPGPAAQSGAAAVGLRVPSALPRRDAAVRDRRAVGDTLRRRLDSTMLARRRAAGEGGI